MANDTISFFCPACATRLTVPAAFAGVVGPCPTCGTTIQAPIPATSPAIPPLYTPELAAPASAPVPDASPAPIPLPEPVQSPQAEPRGSLRPEPRQLPQRSNHEVCAKPMPEPDHVTPAHGHKAIPVPRHPAKSSPLARCFMLLLLLILSGALVYGILAVLKSPSVTRHSPDRPVEPSPQQTAGTPAVVPDKTPPSPAEVPSPSPAPAKNPVPALPTPPIDKPDITSPPAELPAGIEPVSRAEEATEVLERFLAAKTLDERKDLIETLKPELDLSGTCLAGPLPDVRKMPLEFIENNPTEQLTEYFHRVEFVTSAGQSQPFFVLVRVRGKSAPKVVIDPFLDLYGGRLAAYAAKPTDKAAYFQVVVSALSTCTDTSIPDYEKKMTLKIMTSDNGKEITRAFFGKQSKIAAMLQDGTHDLSYGNPKACTVMLSWNTEDKAEKPYLVASAITSLDWNP